MANRQQGKYGWAKQFVAEFLAQSDGNEKCWSFIECPDQFGRNQMQVYKTLYKAIRHDFFDDPVEVKILDDWPNQVWLHRTDGDDA